MCTSASSVSIALYSHAGVLPTIVCVLPDMASPPARAAVGAFGARVACRSFAASPCVVALAGRRRSSAIAAKRRCGAENGRRGMRACAEEGRCRTRLAEGGRRNCVRLSPPACALGAGGAAGTTNVSRGSAQEPAAAAIWPALGTRDMQRKCRGAACSLLGRAAPISTADTPPTKPPGGGM